MLKVVIIGTGRHSLDHHGHACAMLGDSIDRAAVCSLDLEQARKYAEETGFHQVYHLGLVRPYRRVVPEDYRLNIFLHALRGFSFSL